MKLNKYLQDEESLASLPKTRNGREMAIDREINFEKTARTFPTQISKGTLASNLGGVFELRDATGGTVLLTANPDTGVVTINGALQASVTVTLGTLTNSFVSGTNTFSGTITNNALLNGGTYNTNVIGTPAITGGTINTAVIGTPSLTGGTVNSTFQASGSAGINGTTVYVKNLVPGDLGTMIFKGGLLISSA
jgi:hypothetical protein